VEVNDLLATFCICKLTDNSVREWGVADYNLSDSE